MKLILSADEMNFTVHWYVDGSHQIHKNCRGQIGCLMTMGKGAAISSLNIMKCNTRSSTETELISVHDKLPDIIWTRYFVECQGYDIDEDIVYQDNMSSLSLEKNGRISSSKRTKHIKAKYFLIKDYYNSGEIDLRYCPTDVMWADVLTKPLQGQKFRDMRAFLQNCPRDFDNNVELQTDQLARKLMNQQAKTVASSRKCVGEQTNLQINPLQTDQLARKSMNQQAKTVASSRECFGEQTNLQINPPRSRSCSPTCVSELQVNSKKHVGPKNESLHNKRKVTFKQGGPHIYPDRPDIMVNRIT
jgi:hypothetical protein